MSPILLAPSVLSADFGRLAEEVQAVEAAGADWIHVDVMDGHFVPNLTIGAGVTAAIRRATSLPVDVHLMIEAPERYIGDFAEAGADRITVHQEACPHLHRVVQGIREVGALPGVALNPATPVETLSEILPELELVLIMSVNPGFGGQRYIRGSEGRVERVRNLAAEVGALPSLEVQVDGGVDVETAPLLARAGASILVAGSAVYGHPRGAAAGVRAIREAVEGDG